MVYKPKYENKSFQELKDIKYEVLNVDLMQENTDENF